MGNNEPAVDKSDLRIRGNYGLNNNNILSTAIRVNHAMCSFYLGVVIVTFTLNCEDNFCLVS